MKRIHLNTLKMLLLLILILSMGVLTGCPSGSLRSIYGTTPASTAPTTAVDTSPEGQLFQMAETAYELGDFQVAYASYMEYLNKYERGKYAPEAALGILESLVSSGKAEQAVTEGKYYSGMLRTNAQIAHYNAIMEHADAVINGVTSTSFVATRAAVIGCLLPMSGSYERFGRNMLRGIELALLRFQEQNPGVQVDLVIKDTGGTREQTVSAINELASNGVAAIVGPFEEVEAAAETAQRVGVPIMIISQRDGIGSYGDYVFKNFMNAEMQVGTLVDYAMQQGIKNFAVLYPSENFGQRYMEIFSNAVNAKGGNLVAAVPYNTQTKADFGPELKRLKAAGGFQALFIPEGVAMTEMIIPQVYFYDLHKGSRLLGTNLWHDEKLLRTSANYLDNAVISDAFSVESGRANEVWFFDKFEEMYNQAPSFIDAITFDSTYLVLKAASAANATNRAQVRNNIMYMRMPETITGFKGFDSNGEALREISLLTVKGHEFVDIQNPSSFKRVGRVSTTAVPQD